jgi:hypothetical protein
MGVDVPSPVISSRPSAVSRTTLPAGLTASPPIALLFEVLAYATVACPSWMRSSRAAPLSITYTDPSGPTTTEKGRPRLTSIAVARADHRNSCAADRRWR